MQEEKVSTNRIGILTFHWADNYGAMLQAYGLLSWLLQHDFNAFVINYVPLKLRSREWLLPYVPAETVVRRVGVSMITFFRNVWTGRDWWIRRRNMETFRITYLTKGSKAIYRTEKLSHIATDILVVGSDQIWSPRLMFGFHPPYFGAFANRQSKKTIAYGASFGTTTLPEMTEMEFSKLLATVYKISMREKSAAEYIKKRFGRVAAPVIDPIFLLSKGMWETIKDEPEKKDYVLYHETENNEIMRKAAYLFAKANNLRVIELTDRKKRRQKKWPFEIVYSAGPQQFLGYIDSAQYVFTNSFHGVAFSILFHKQFVAYNHSIAKARIVDLLDSTNLIKRMANETYTPAITKKIDWEDVESRLQVQRENSETFLYHGLTL